MGQVPSMAAQIIITIIPIVGIVMGSIVAFFYLLWHHKRTVLLIEAGKYERPAFDLLSFCLLAGMLLAFLGLSLTTFLGVLKGFDYGLLGGVIPLAIGLSLLAYYAVRRGERGR
ncbi:MAG: hypothetical protein WCT14_01490 [Treponemataceae bacterium]